MAQEGYDKLLALTDSRYRLSMIVAKRAAQLKFGVPTVLDVDDVPKNENTVSLAMKEFILTDEVKWNEADDLPTLDEIRRTIVPPRVEPTPTYSGSLDDDDD